MAENKPKDASAEQVGPGAQDRVEMLSIAKDGTPDQAPDTVLIGDKDATLAATKRQFTERAVAAVDEAKNAEDAKTEVVEDKSVAERKAEHDKAAKAAERQAEAVVEKLTK